MLDSGWIRWGLVSMRDGRSGWDGLAPAGIEVGIIGIEVWSVGIKVWRAEGSQGGSW